MWSHATLALGILCCFLGFFLFDAKRQLTLVLSKNKKYSTVQKVFSKAVAGIEASLEQEKQTSAQLFRALESINDGVAIIDKDGFLQYANTSLWRLYAIPYEHKDRYMGRSWLNLHSPKGQEEIKNVVMPALDRMKIWIGETDVLIGDGSLIRAELYISKNDEGYIGFIRDVTDRHKAVLEHEKLQAQIHQLQKSDAVERVVRAMVHEFNNSIASIGGFSEMLIEDLSVSSPQHGYADKIYHASQQMQGLIEQTRLLIPGSRAETAQVSDILGTLSIVVGDLKKKISRPFDISQDIHVEEAKVKCDPFRLNQILFHVLKNAIESQTSKSILLDIDAYRHGFDNISATDGQIYYQVEKSEAKGIRLHYGVYDPKAEYVQITIRDHGRGIGRDVMEHILDPFFSTKKQDTQTGLGMSIVRSVIRYCEGYLMINSVSGEGTIVTIMLPALSATVSDSRSTKAVIQQLIQEMT